MEFSSVIFARPASPHDDAGPQHLAFEARESADPTSAGGDVPSAVFQTWVTGGRVQDSSTPQVMSLVLSPAAAAALASTFSPADEATAAPDQAGGDLGAHFRVVLVRGDLRPVEAWDDVASTYAPLQVPQSTFSFAQGRGRRVTMEMKRKHLPPSKNHGDVFFRLLVQLRVDVLGDRPVAVSSAFRIFSKQSTAAPRPEPKRRRNPAPTKPFVAPFDAASASIVASFPSLGVVASADTCSTASTEKAGAEREQSPPPEPTAAAAVAARARVTSMPPPAPRRSARASKRSRLESDDGHCPPAPAGGPGKAVRPPGAMSTWEPAAEASVPRAGPGRGTFSFSPGMAEDADTASDDEMASLGRGDSFGTDSQGFAEPDDSLVLADDDEEPFGGGASADGHSRSVRARLAGPFAFPAGVVAPVAPPKFQAEFVRCLGQGVLLHAGRPRAESIPSGSPTGFEWGTLA